MSYTPAKGGLLGPFVSDVLTTGVTTYSLKLALPPGLSGTAPIAIANRPGRVISISISIMNNVLGVGETLDCRPTVDGSSGFSATLNENDFFAVAQGLEDFAAGQELRGVAFAGATMPGGGAYIAMFLEIEYDVS